MKLFNNGKVWFEGTKEELEAMAEIMGMTAQELVAINNSNKTIAAVNPTPVESTKGAAEKSGLTLTNEQKAIVAKCKPTHSKGKDVGSLYYCVRECGYSFCGGRDKFKRDVYILGKRAFFTVYDEEFRKTLPDSI